jgi:hypothetical protein
MTTSNTTPRSDFDRDEAGTSSRRRLGIGACGWDFGACVATGAASRTEVGADDDVAGGVGVGGVVATVGRTATRWAVGVGGINAMTGVVESVSAGFNDGINISFWQPGHWIFLPE